MRFAVIGAGGLGGYFGARLAAAGHDVTFLARGATAAVLRRDGIRVVGALDLHVPQVGLAEDAAAIGPVDAVVLSVKTNHLDGVLPGLPALVGPGTAILTMQNGVGTPDEVAAVVGPGHVLPCVVRIFTKIQAPGVIEHMGGPGSVSFGELDGATSERVVALREAFAGAGVPVLEPADVRIELWEKAIYVAPLGALGAAADAPLGVVRTRLREELAAVVAEEVAVARAQGIALPADAVERMLAFTDGMPAESSTSMQRDLAEGRPNELDGQIGVIVRMGRELGVPTPRHDLLYAVLACRFSDRS